MKSLTRSIKHAKTLPKATMLLLTLTWTLLASGCRTELVPMSDERRVETLKAGVPYTPRVNGKFVPDAQYLDMQGAYIRESFRK